MQKRYPFKFLNSYNAEDTDMFFGREAEIDQLYEMIYQTNLILIYGFSGTGKSSLIQCGLATKFQSHQWMPLFVRRGNNLNQSLEIVLDDCIKKNEATKEELNQLEKNTFSLSKKFKSIYLEYFKPIYLIFDQFEELYILGDKAEQKQFIETIQEILQFKQPIKMIFSIREEYLGFLYDFEKAVPELLRKKIRVEPMNLDKVSQVIKGLAALEQSLVYFPNEESRQEEFAGLLFEKLKGKNSSLIQLPYLQVFLDKMYHDISQDSEKQTEVSFTLEALETTPNIGDVLANFLNVQTLETALILKVKEEQIWEVLSSFVTLEGTKEPLDIESVLHNNPALPKFLIHDILKQLLDKRILRMQEGNGMYEIAHDSLARQIANKRTEEQISLLEVRRLIKTQAAHNKGKEYFSEKQLAFIDPFLQKVLLENHEKEWIEESRKVIHMRKEEEESRKKEELIKAKKKTLVMSLFFFSTLILLFACIISLLMATYAQKKAAKYLDSISNTELKFAELKVFSLDTSYITYEILKNANENRNKINKQKVKYYLAILAYISLFQYPTEKWDNIKAFNFFKIDNNEIIVDFEDNNRPAFSETLQLAKKIINKTEARKYVTNEMVALLGNEIMDSVNYLFWKSNYTSVSPDSFKLLNGGKYEYDSTDIPVNVSSFYISPTEVTFGQISLFAMDNGIPIANFTFKEIPHIQDAAVFINWFQAIRFCNWLSEQKKMNPAYKIYDEYNNTILQSNKTYWNDSLWFKVQFDKSSKGYRLPHEIEWEYAASGYEILHEKQKYAGCDSLSDLLNYAWIYTNSLGHVQKVSTKLGNVNGLFDMSGNVWEWCFNEFINNTEVVSDYKSKNIISIKERLLQSKFSVRSGSWDGASNDSQVNMRYEVESDFKNDYTGLRLLRNK